MDLNYVFISLNHKGVNMFFHFGMLEKYTATLLELFGSVETEEGVKVPIKFSSLEKASILSGVPEELLHSGNVNFLPRMCLVFSDMSVNWNRGTNKFKTINQSKNIENSIGSFQYNSIPYDFNFVVVLQARNMREASIIAEQILSYFNPSYTIRMFELEFQKEPTSIQLDLTGTSFDIEEYSEYSQNIVSVTFNLLLKGNIYPPLKETALVNKVKIGLGSNNKNIKSFDSFETYDYNDYNFYIKDIKTITKDNCLILEPKINCKDYVKDNLLYDWEIENGSILKTEFNKIKIKKGSNIKITLKVTNKLNNEIKEYIKIL